MSAFAVVLLLTGAAGLGVYLGMLYLRGERRPWLIGLHLLLGATGLEGMLILQHGAPNGEVAAGGSLGPVAIVLLGVAMVCGFASPLLSRRSKRNAELALITHVSVAGAGFLLFLAWVTQL